MSATPTKRKRAAGGGSKPMDPAGAKKIVSAKIGPKAKAIWEALPKKGPWLEEALLAKGQ